VLVTAEDEPPLYEHEDRLLLVMRG